MAATIRTSADLVVERRDTLFTTDAPVATETTYDVMPDGKHFIMTKTIASGAAPRLVFGWAHEVEERLAAAARR